MKITHMLAIAALAALFITNFASQASAQDAARDAAIHKCVNEAQARYPNVGQEDTMRARTDVYRSCMAAAGQRP